MTTAPSYALLAVVPPVPPAPVSVRRGHPTAEELAALLGALAVVARRSAAQGGGPAPVLSRWRVGSGLRAAMPHGPGAWRAALR